MTGPTAGQVVAGPAPEEPSLVVMWHGNRVQVFADGRLGVASRRNGRPTHPSIEAIAAAITDAETVAAMAADLRASAVGEAHEVEVRVADGVLQLWLRERPGAGS